MFRLFFCLLLVWGSNKFERDFSLFCLVFWAFRFPLKIVFQGYDYQSHSYTQFICFKYIFTGCPFLLPGLFKTIFSILIPGLLFWDCWFFSENILRKEASAHFSLSNTLSHFPKFSAYTSATEIHLDHPPHHTPGTGLQCLLHCWTKKQKMWCLKFWTNLFDIQCDRNF